MEERAISTNGPRTMRYTGEKAKTNQPINKIQHSFPISYKNELRMGHIEKHKGKPSRSKAKQWSQI